MSVMAPELPQRTQQLGRALLAETRRQPASGLFAERLMNWALQDDALRVALFRFVDVFPALKTPAQVHAVLADYLAGVPVPAALSMALAAGGLLQGTMARTIAAQIESLARRFIAGRAVADALPILRRQWDAGLAFSVDLLGEACVSDAEADAYRTRYLELLRVLPQAVAPWLASNTLERDHLGSVPRVNVSVKISSLYARIKPAAHETSIRGLLASLTPILQQATAAGAALNFDMEQHALKELTLELFMRACEASDFPAALAVQAYLRSAEEDAARLIAWAQRTGRQVTVRLIKGAYWDYETIHARLLNWPAPVWTHKGQTDACFERLVELFVRAMPRQPGTGGVKLAVGTHNVRSIAHALAAVEAAGLPASAVEFQMLRGMADELKATLVQRGLRVREYVPVGELIPGMAYLVRRLLENTSNESWLRAGFREQADDAVLLAAPDAAPEMPREPPRASAERFENEPPRDFSDPKQRQVFAAAVDSATVPHVPSSATPADAEQALAQAYQARETWRRTSLAERANMLRRAADLIHARRDAFAALMVLEAGKPWTEADGDVCEAIDYLRYYATQAERLLAPQTIARLPGEDNLQVHEPRGVAVVIAPWNFPLAIPCGMTVAALVAGNPTILKPAEQTPAIAQALCAALWEAGVPRGALGFLPGDGASIGAALVRDPRTAIVAFTGSQAVGLQIIRETAETLAAQAHVKRVVCEMGGKNAIIVDATADLDEAVLGVIHSAFSYAGQKCSACSRLIVEASVHDAFVARLVQAAASLRLGDPRDPATDMGPLIDAAAATKVREYIARGQHEARQVLPPVVQTPPSALPRATGFGDRLIPPHIFVNVAPTARIATEEIFGPVLAVLQARNFTHALELANASTYRLTGGVFSRTPSHLALAAQEFRVGNLYLNRAITGALVGRQPFGGGGLSGLGPQAGGSDYLRAFTEPRVVTENLLRRGFAPGDG